MLILKITLVKGGFEIHLGVKIKLREKVWHKIEKCFICSAECRPAIAWIILWIFMVWNTSVVFHSKGCDFIFIKWCHNSYSLIYKMALKHMLSWSKPAFQQLFLCIKMKTPLETFNLHFLKTCWGVSCCWGQVLSGIGSTQTRTAQAPVVRPASYNSLCTSLLLIMGGFGK